jgi:hypothetical protein
MIVVILRISVVRRSWAIGHLIFKISAAATTPISGSLVAIASVVRHLRLTVGRHLRLLADAIRVPRLSSLGSVDKGSFFVASQELNFDFRGSQIDLFLNSNQRNNFNDLNLLGFLND